MLPTYASPPDAGTLERISSSPLAWAIAGILLLAAGYFVIRLLELDLINQETPNQEDPLPR